MDTIDTKPASDQPDKTGPEQVRAWEQEINRRVAKEKVPSPEFAWKVWLEYEAKQTKDKSVPTFTGYALALGFCSESGLFCLMERGPEYADICKRVSSLIVDGIVQRMMSARANQVGCIFWLKNKAGFRDKQPDEIAAENEDWLTKILDAKLILASGDRSGNPPQTTDQSQAPDSQEDTQELSVPDRPVIRVA